MSSGSRFFCLILASAGLAAEAATRYVDLANATPAAPYTNWVTAATSIQDAIDAASVGDLVLVSNGVYDTGGRLTPGGSTSNRVVVDKALTLQSVNGPSATFIRGVRTTNSTATRCVYLGPNAFLSGFTLTNGGTRADGDIVLNRSGAGVLCGAGAVVSNCLIAGNWAQFGGGISQGTIVNSRIAQNYAFISGGGLFVAQAAACEFLDNAADLYGGGMRSGTASNCLFTGNSVLDLVGGGSRGSAAQNSTLVHCTVISNIGPAQVANSAVLNSIVYFARGTTPMNHDPDLNYVSYFTNSCTTPLPLGAANITAHPQLVNYRLSETSPCIDAGDSAFAGATDLAGAPRMVSGTPDMGAFEFQFRYVDIANTNPVAPYVSWATAATTIQAAVDTAFSGSVVIVSNGVYQTGGRVMSGAMTNRVAVDKPLALRSVNGPGVTAIRGAKDATSGSNGNAAVRGVYLADGASICGFTVTGGATRTTGSYPAEQTGGGVFTPSSGVISNCVIAGNSAHADGGGVYAGDVFDSRLAGNTARLGGGSSGSDLTRCMVLSNRAADAGGVYGGNILNTLLAGNLAVSNAGAAELSSLIGCTVYGNSAGVQGGGARNTTVGNCIVVSNTAPSGPNFAFPGVSSNIFNTCTSPQANGAGNITNAPLFLNAASGDFRLKAGSPCINTGNNFYAIGPTDLQGDPRVAGNYVDLGAYEYDQALADYDSDGDTWTDAEEYVSDTSPTNAALYFRDAAVASTAPNLTGLIISNTSAARLYSIHRSTNLVAAPQAWTRISSEVGGNGGTLTIVVTNNDPSAHFRTAVRKP